MLACIMFTILVKRVSMLTRTAEADGNAVHFAGIWSYTNILNRQHLDLMTR